MFPRAQNLLTSYYLLIVVLLGTPLWLAPGLVKLLPAVAYHFCLNLPEAFTKPGARHKGVPSTGLGLKVVPRLRECCR